jgi:acyl-CoA dehydrogenase
MSQTTTSMIAEALARMLEDCKPAADGFDARLWRTVSDSGVPRLLRPETEGGAGESAWPDALEVLQVWAQSGADIPLADTVLAHRLLAQVAVDPGESTAVVLQIAGPDGAPDPVQPPKAQAGLAILEVSPWGATVTGRLHGADGTSTELHWSDAARVRAELAATAAAVLTGAMRQAFDLTLSYTGTRVQFGKAISQFQAVQHALALAAEEIAASRATLDWAGADLTQPGCWPSTFMAKGRAADAAGKVAAITHQAHGAIGFTAEYALFRSTRLLWTWRERWGDEQHWNAELGRAALGQGPDALFDLVIGDSPLAS